MDRWKLDMGGNFLENGDVLFKVWAPRVHSVSVVNIAENKEIRSPMKAIGQGIFELTFEAPLSNFDYFFCINDLELRSDPVSRWQPFGVNGPSRLYNPLSFAWTDHTWKGLPLKDYLIYELHVGTFTSEGTFEAIIEKLIHLKELGINAIELMPIIEFPGKRNWGYDGVSLYAPHHQYGGPLGLKKLINACHESGIAVILDVVYNHLGPEGNYLGQFGPYFTERYKTLWGQAINYDGPESDFVRKYFIDNALYWLTEYHVDALRLDAIQAIFDFSARHILEEIGEAFHRQANLLGRKAFIIAESDLNDVRIIKSIEQGGCAVDAQWSDDFHHAVYAFLTGSQWEYFKDFGKLSHIAKALTEGFVYDGNYSSYRKKKFGSSSTGMLGDKFVVCLQNHDQVANAEKGSRLGEFITEKQYKLASMLLFCAPNLPLIFMGQEWNCSSSFLYFTSFEDEKLAQSVREGYQREFKLENKDSFDPQNSERFQRSKINWEEVKKPAHEHMFGFYKRLISLRKKFSCLSNCRNDLMHVDFNEEEQWLILNRRDFLGSEAILILNFGDKSCTLSVVFDAGLWQLQLSSSDIDQIELTFWNDKRDSRSLKLPPQSGILYIKEA